MLATHGFAKEGIINLAKKIMEVIRKKAAHHVISATGHEEAEKLFGNKPQPQEEISAGFEGDDDEADNFEDEPEKVEPVKLGRYENIRDIKTLLKKEFGAKISSKQALIKELEDGNLLKGEVVSKLKKLNDIFKTKIPNMQLVFDIQTLLGYIEPRTFKYTGGKEEVQSKKTRQTRQTSPEIIEKKDDDLGLPPDDFAPKLPTGKPKGSGNPFDV